MTRSAGLALGLGAALCLATGFAPAMAETPKRGGTLTVGVISGGQEENLFPGTSVGTPDFVRDYIIYHELMHLREMNHSVRFWARVEEVCPGWRDAERWIKRNGALVGL